MPDTGYVREIPSDEDKMSGVQGRSAIVTGAAQGIGLAIARRLAEAGARVMLADVNGAKAGAAAAALREAGGDVRAAETDVASSASVARLVAAAVEAFGTVDILVNNAGGSGQVGIADIEDVTDEIWDAVVNVNLRGAFYCSRAVAPLMKANGHGRIVNMSSVLARGAAGPVTTVGARLPYSASKSGVEGLTRQLAKDLAPFEITVNAIVPGLVMTEPGARMHERFTQLDPDLQARVRAAFNERPATGDDVAAMVLYLASDETSRVTGQEIAIGTL
jgi:3-oxoacyl-[acyl-carrier protein] reductase